jgi:hypothetical protein
MSTTILRVNELMKKWQVLVVVGGSVVVLHLMNLWAVLSVVFGIESMASIFIMQLLSCIGYGILLAWTRWEKVLSYLLGTGVFIWTVYGALYVIRFPQYPMAPFGLTSALISVSLAAIMVSNVAAKSLWSRNR